MYQFQLKGVEFALSRHGRVFIGDEMGTGKTLQALTVAYIYKSEWPLIILCPASLKFVWYNEILKWFPNFSKENIEIIKNAKHQPMETSKVIIVSYSHAKDLLPKSKKAWNVIIADEAHYLKNRDSKRSRALAPILIQARRVILLSGTPMVGRPADIYSGLHMLRPDIFKNFREFGHRYCDPKKGKYGIEWKGASNIDELHFILNISVVIRRLKSDVLVELPGKQKQVIEVEADPIQVKKIRKLLGKYTPRDISKALLDTSLDKTEEESSSNSEDIRNSILTTYKMTAISKTNAITDFLDNLIENDVKFLFYAQHISLLDSVTEYLQLRELDFIRIDGGVPIGKRQELVNKFQNLESCKIALLSLTTSSQGLTLTSANTVVFGEYHWTPGIMDQAEARVHRVGQIKAVNIYYLHSSGTLDDILANILKGKGDIMAKVIDGKSETENEVELENSAKVIERKVASDFQFITQRNEDVPSFVKSVGKPSSTFEFSSKKKTWSEAPKRHVADKDLLDFLELSLTESQEKTTITKPETISKRLRNEIGVCQEFQDIENKLDKVKPYYD